MLAVIACSSVTPSENAFLKDTRAFCSVHSIDYWEASGQLEELNTLGPTEKQIRLTEEIRSTITSEEIIYAETQALSAANFYP